jgi:hypothetical protein
MILDREIKFRAWDAVDKKMYIPNSLGFDYLGNLVFVSANDAYRNNFDDGSKLTLMQFTGLYDKNGKEIYEGDILKDCWDNIHSVIYNRRWETILHIFKGRFPARYLDCSWMEWEIIGNIYETPELIREVMI